MSWRMPPALLRVAARLAGRIVAAIVSAIVLNVFCIGAVTGEKAGLGAGVVAGMDSSVLAGHSMRIGAAKDVVAVGAKTLQAMQAGRWKSAGMVARYTKNLADADNAVMKFRKAAKVKRAQAKVGAE